MRSGKHDSSSAYTHAYDLIKLFEDKLISNKPILILETDGAMDEAPRSPSTLKCAIYVFKTYDCDVIIHGVNAAGLSAYNIVER